MFVEFLNIIDIHCIIHYINSSWIFSQLKIVRNIIFYYSSLFLTDVNVIVIDYFDFSQQILLTRAKSEVFLDLP